MADKSLCKIDGCGKPVVTRGWCEGHYRRWRVHGDPLGGRTPDGEPLAFLEEALGADTDECIVWPFGRGSDGYARVWFDGRVRPASRIVCERVHGAPPTPKHEAAHSCGKGHEGCINHRHLRWASPAENCADTLIHGTSARGERQGNSKLTEADVREIRSLLGTMKRAEIADRFGVSGKTIGAIHRRENWAWLK